MKHMVPGLNRLNWLSFREFCLFYPQNRGDWAEAADLAHERSSKDYQAQHESGDENAIFKFMSSTQRAYRELWVQNQIEAWHEEASPDSKKKIRKLATVFTLMKGYRTARRVISDIEKDITIFVFVLQHRDSGRKLHDDIFPECEEKYRLSCRKIKEIWEYYNQEMGKVLDACESKKKDFAVVIENGPVWNFFKYYPNYDFSEAAFIAFLKDSLKNLKKYVG